MNKELMELINARLQDEICSLYESISNIKDRNKELVLSLKKAIEVRKNEIKMNKRLSK